MVPVESPIEYKQVRLLVIDGRRSSDQEGLLSFAAGNVTLMSPSTGAGVASMPYADLVKATYVRGRDPKWDATLAGPPEDLDVGGIFRTPKHWLVLQGRENFMVLRLEDNNWRPIVNTVVDRTGVQLTLPNAEK